jgi:hypothetical protein
MAMLRRLRANAFDFLLIMDGQMQPIFIFSTSFHCLGICIIAV